ncbi:methyltransferase domain-containing protein [Panacibacter ginsenosidivorans]|uniref:Methyltransferase domain-containing protein n=1 Tax=Panacibacter ginsenosidivorans TaxID=1813871 RepID=A0A5B8V507_9BACT|nr:class I SAM-dependent methyltransferase [Panacibacter ginsenosidivorans]QEC66577.1 methyltransferase domain-containing protein [Panacibacter ginsenosidivorans]
MPEENILFGGNVPANYDRYLGPFLFEPYARDMVNRIDATVIKDVLEIACGTGRVTRQLSNLFRKSANITASDFSIEMVKVAERFIDNDHVRFVQADAQSLPFEDNSFDLVVCQFGFMFVPDKPKGFSEAFRVLRKGGTLLFNTWDSLENNPATEIVNKVIIDFFKGDGPLFFKIPHGLYNASELQQLLQGAGFSNVHVQQISIEGTSPSALDIAKGFVTGTPMFGELTTLDPALLEKIINKASENVAAVFGDNPVRTPLSAWVSSAQK